MYDSQRVSLIAGMEYGMDGGMKYGMDGECTQNS